MQRYLTTNLQVPNPFIIRRIHHSPHTTPDHHPHCKSNKAQLALGYRSAFISVQLTIAPLLIIQGTCETGGVPDEVYQVQKGAENAVGIADVDRRAIENGTDLEKMTLYLVSQTE